MPFSIVKISNFFRLKRKSDGSLTKAKYKSKQTAKNAGRVFMLYDKYKKFK